MGEIIDDVLLAEIEIKRRHIVRIEKALERLRHETKGLQIALIQANSQLTKMEKMKEA